MRWRQDLAESSQDTVVIVALAEQLLVEYFHHETESAEDAITQYFRRYRSQFDEAFVRHEHSWRIATAAHFTVHLNGNPSNLPFWRVENGCVRTPMEVVEFLDENYWKPRRP